MSILNYNRWFRYNYTLRSTPDDGWIPMPQYDPNQFRPQPQWDETKGAWIDPNRATRTVNRRPEVEQAIEERARRGYGLEDIALKPHALPKSADPSKFRSPADFEKMRQTSDYVQSARAASGGKLPEITALEIGDINKNLRSGAIPLEVAGHAANVAQRMRQEGNRTKASNLEELSNIGNREPREGWAMVPQQNLPTRAEVLAGYHQAQPAVQALQRRSAINASRLAGQHIPLAVVRKYMPDLSHEQLAAVQSPAQAVSTIGGPGSGKSKVLTSLFFNDVVNQGLSREQATKRAQSYVFLSQTHAAGQNLKNSLEPFKQIMPGFDPGKQTKTLSSYAMSLLTRGQTSGGSILQKMGLGNYSPLYGGTGETIEEELEKRAQEQVLSRVFARHKIDPRINNINQLSQDIARIKGTSQDAFTQAKDSGKQQFGTQTSWQKRSVPANVALYLYQEQLHKEKKYDINDVPRILLKASETVGLPRENRILMDENQNTPRIYIELMKRLMGPQSRLMAAGDPSQMTIRQPWDTHQEIADVFGKRASAHQLRINFRQGPYGVAQNNAAAATKAMQEGGPLAPFQASFRGPGSDYPPEVRVEKDLATTHQAMLTDWMKHMGTSPKQIASNMQAGVPAFSDTTKLPIDAPMIFQMNIGAESAIDQWKQMLGKHMTPEMTEQFVSQNISREPLAPENAMKAHMVTVGKALGAESDAGFIEATRAGKWDQAGYMGQLYTGGSRAKNQNFFYGSQQNYPGSTYDQTPSFFGGQPTIAGFDQLHQAMTENLVTQQGFLVEDLPPMLQHAWNSPHAMHLGDQQDMMDPKAVSQYAEAIAFLQQYYNPAVNSGTGSGMLEGDKGLTSWEDPALGELRGRRNLNALAVAGQTKRSSVNAGKIDLSDRMMQSMMREGVRGPVPSHTEFMDLIDKMAGPIPMSAMRGDEPTAYAPTEIPEIDNIQMKPWAGENQWYEGADVTNMRKTMGIALSSPAFRDFAPIQTQLRGHFTNPKVAQDMVKPLRELATSNAQMNLAHQQLLTSQTPAHVKGDAELAELREMSEKYQLSKDQTTKLEVLEKQQGKDAWKFGRGSLQDLMSNLTTEGNSLYRPELASTAYKGAAKVLPWKRLDTSFVSMLGKRAASFAGSPSHTESSGFWNEAAKKFQAHVQSAQSAGIQVTQKDLDRIGTSDPMQSRLLGRLFGDEKSGELLPYTDPQVEKNVSQIVYKMGQSRRSIGTSEEGAKFRMSRAQSHGSPAQTEWEKFYHHELQGGFKEGHGSGVADPHAIRQTNLGEESQGTGTPLHSLINRLTALSAKDVPSDPDWAQKQQGFASQLRQAQFVQSQFGSKSNQRDWGHLMRVVNRATTGKDVIDLGVGDEHKGDPIRAWLKHRESTVDAPRSLESLSGLAQTMSAVSEHLQKTGSLKRSHIDDILSAFGHKASDKQFTGLHKLEQKGFRRESGADPVLPLRKIIGEFPKASADLHAQMTRVPLLQDTQYQYMAGQPGYATVKSSQKGIPAGMTGTLHPIPGENTFGLSKQIATHLSHYMMDQPEAKFQETQPYASKQAQSMPLVQFRGTHAGKEHQFLVNPDQLAFADTKPHAAAHAQLEQDRRARFAAASQQQNQQGWQTTIARGQAIDSARKERSSQAGRKQEAISAAPQRRYEPLVLDNLYQQRLPVAPSAPTSAPVSPSEKMVHYQGQWMPKSAARAMKNQEIAAKSQPIGSHRGYQLGGDITKSVIDSIIAAQRARKEDVPESPWGPVDPRLQPMLPGFGGNGGLPPTTPPSPPMPQPEGEEGGNIPSPSALSDLNQLTPSPLAIGGTGFSAFQREPPPRVRPLSDFAEGPLLSANLPDVPAPSSLAMGDASLSARARSLALSQGDSFASQRPGPPPVRPLEEKSPFDDIMTTARPGVDLRDRSLLDSTSPFIGGRTHPLETPALPRPAHVTDSVTHLDPQDPMFHTQSMQAVEPLPPHADPTHPHFQTWSMKAINFDQTNPEIASVHPASVPIIEPLPDPHEFPAVITRAASPTRSIPRRPRGSAVTTAVPLMEGAYRPLLPPSNQAYGSQYDFRAPFAIPNRPRSSTIQTPGRFLPLPGLASIHESDPGPQQRFPTTRPTSLSRYQQRMLLQHASQLSSRKRGTALTQPFRETGSFTGNMPNIAPLPRKVVDTGPQGLLSQLPAEDFYGGPSEEEMPHLTSWLNDQDAQNAPDIPQTALPSPVPKSPVGPPRYQLGDASTLLRSPERMQIREGRVHPFDPGQKGIGIGGLSPEQRAVLDSSDQHQIIQGGPGTGKTDTMIMKMLDLISSGNLDPGKIMAFSGMHSGVSEINSRFNKFLRPLLPQGEGSKIPAATTIHSLAHQINFPGGEPSPLLGKIGRGYLKDIIANPSEEELALQTPETADLMRDQQYRFLSSTLQKSFPNEKKLPTTNAQLKNLNSEIQKFKRNRIGPNSAYEKAMKQGTEELGQGKFTHSSALAAYEQNMRAEGHGDFDDSLTIAREQMEHAGAQAIPPHLRDTQLVAYDEAQDSNMENLGFVSQLSRSLGQDSKMLVGLDPMQALFQGSGSFAAKHIIPTISKMMGGATHTQLRSNYRSSKRDVALGNAVLGKISKLTGNKGLSPEQVPQSLDAGKPAHFLMEKSQPDLYRSMFQSMLGESGAPMHLIKKNILAGNHPLEGIDSDKDWSARPGESPAIFQTHAARNLFEHEAPSVLQGFDPGISPEMAKTAFKQMYRRGLPSRFAKRGEREAFDEKKYFRGMMTGESRGLAFDTPHSDVTPQGEWRKPENLESYLHNLYVQISRVKEGGQNIIGAARLPFDSRQSQTYMNTAGAHYRDTAPGSLSEGTIYYGPGKKQFLTQHPANELDTYDGRAVPAHFGDILKAQASQVATLPDVVRSNTPRLGKTPIDAKHVAMVQQLHEEFGKQKDKTWPQFMSAKVPEIKDLAGEKSHVTQFAQQMAAAPEKYAPGNVSIPGAPQSSIAPTGNVTIQAPPGGKVDVTGTQVSVSQGTAPGRQPAPSATLPPPLMTGGSSFISPIGRKIAAMGQTPSVSGSPMGAQWVAGIGEAPDTSGGSGGRKPPTLFDKATDTGRTFARIGGEMEFFGKLLDSVAQKAIDQGSDYRLASGRFAGSGATADRGFFDFANGQSGISQMQNNNLQMFSKTQIAQNLQNVASMTGGQAPPSGTSQSILQLSALTGMDPTQLTSQIGAIGGSMGQGMNATPQLAGYLGSLYKGQVSAINATPTLQAVQSALPSMQGLTFGQGNNLGALFGLMNAGISGGMTAANMPDVASLTNSLAQVGTAPGLNQQAALSQLFPGQLTGGVQLAQYQQQQSQMGEQAQQLGLQQAFNVPGLQIQINNADIAMKQANLNLSQVQFQQGQAELGLQTQQLGYSQAQLNYQNLQYQYSQAQFGQQQYVATQQYGPIGADTGRNSYFDFMRNQQAAGYNPLSAETGTQFKASAPQGIQNMQFYAGVENQRQDLILSRSPLLSDALFQQQMKNLNQQEAFYKEELDLTNEQRTFDVTWTTKLLDAQGKLLPMQQGILDTQKGMLVYTKEELSAQGTILGISQTQVGLAQQMTDYQNADLQLQQKYLPQQIAELQNIQTAMAQSIAGQGPINGANPTPQQIIRQLSLITDPTQQQNTIRNLGLPPDQVNTLNTILTGMKSAGGYDAAMKGVTPADKSVQSQVNNLVKSGAFTGQATSAAAADAALNLGGTGAQWTKFVNEFNISNGYLKSMDNALSSINDYIKGWGTFFSMAGPTLTGIGMLLQGFGIGGKLAGIGANFFTGGGAAAAGNTIKSAVTTGAQAISDAAVSAAPVLIPLIIAALGTAVITFTLKWLGDQAAAQGQKNFNNPQQAADNGPSWLSWAHTASPKAVTKAQSAQDQYRATHHGQSMPMDAGSPLAKGTLLGDAWGGIQSGASATWNWLTTPIGGAPQGKPKRTDLLNLPTNDVPSHGVHTAAPVADSNAIVKSLQAGWNAFWAGPGAKGWGSWWSDRGKDWNSWWADRKKGWDSWWTDRATGWNNWWSDRKKGWDNWWTDRAKGWDNWWIDRRKGWDAWWTDRKTDWGNWWTDRAKDWNTFWADRGKDWSKFWSDRGKDINNIWQGAVSQITNFFNPGSKSNIGTLLGNALKSIDWGKIFNIGQIFGGGSSGGGPTSGGSEPAGHPGFSTPHVNTEFHVPMSYGPHQGIDFQAAQGSNLHEFVGGIVSKTGHFDWGGEIDVKVPGGLTERYLHLSGIAVKPGQPVARGQFLGLTGGGTAASGLGYWSSGSHLHTQFDRGTYTGGLDPWPIWKAFGDMNLARYIGGGGGQLLEKFAQGGVAMTPQIASVAEIEPEAIVPLSKLSSMIKNVSASTQSTTTQTRSITVGSLIQNATFIVKSDGNGQMNDQAKDDLMHQILSILEEALQQSNGKLK